ncbi:MAG: hypothetical protein RR737_00415 [Lachnospiraceae bacterium]
MKRIATLIITFCLCIGFSQVVSAAAIPDGNETSDHSIVQIWITDGKNLPDTNENNPVLSVRVIDENGNLIPNAMVTLHLVKPVLTDEIVIKSEENGSTTPTQGNPANEVKYKVFGPNNSEIQYLVRANAQGYKAGVTQPFEINFDVSGTIEITLLKKNPLTDITVTYVVREHDKAEIAFTKADIDKGSAIGAVNVPLVTVPNTPTDKWKLDGYYVKDKKYTAEELAQFIPLEDTIVEIRSMPDQNDDGKDDRDKDDHTTNPDTNDKDTNAPNIKTNEKHIGFNNIQTGDRAEYRGYLIGLGVSLLILVLSFISLVNHKDKEKKK